jgi:glycosyltransferase involved in cell wall biosynthesis
MKIGIITNLYPPNARGGAETVIVRTVGALLALGHDVFVVTGQRRKEGRGIMLDRSSTERIYRFFPKNVYFTLDDHKYPWIIRLFWHVIDAFSHHGENVVRTIIAKEQPDIIFTHNLKGIGLNIPAAIRQANVPHVHVVHDLQLVVPSGLIMFGHEKTPWYTKPFYKIYQKICQGKIKNPDLVLSPSHYLEKMYKEAGFFKRTKMLVVPNPAPNYSPVAAYGRTPGPLRLLFVGQLQEHKGLVFLLDALAACAEDIRLSIVGDGPLSAEVEKRSQKDKRITYLGYIPPGELVKIFHTVDALVVPSLGYENSPTVIYEGLQAGIPIIASRIGGVGELVEEGKNGYLFTPGDTADFCRAVTELNARKDEFAMMGEELRKTVADYTLDKYAAGLTELSKEAIRRHRDRNSPLTVTEKQTR